MPDYPLVARIGVERSEFFTADEQSVPQKFQRGPPKVTLYFGNGHSHLVML